MKRRAKVKGNLSLILGLTVGAWTLLVLSTAFFVRTNIWNHNMEVALGQARGLYQDIVDSRSWNASHGGVYVPVSEFTKPNPYLDVPHRDIETVDGKRLTLINPSYMTRQIAEIGWMRSGLGTHLTSLKPIRPQNAPDTWERQALLSFENGDNEAYEFIDVLPDKPFIRYMAPLITTADCLQCHAKQGYKPDDIRGGVSVSIPADTMLHSVKSDLRVQLSGLAFIWLLGLGIIGSTGHAFKTKQDNLVWLEELSLTDSLTGINNRRGFLTLAQQHLKLSERMGKGAFMLFLDVDKFKEINDTYGHKEGDFALVTVAQLLLASFRRSDIVGRFGGDEFAVLAFGTDREGAGIAMARFQEAIEAKNREIDRPYKIEMSVGMVEFDPKNPVSLEEMILQADTRMYEDKERRKR